MNQNIKTINLHISPKHKIGDKLIYLSGPNHDEPVKVEVVDVCVEGQFFYDPEKDQVFVSELTLYDKTYGRYLLKVLEDASTSNGEKWLQSGDHLYPSIAVADKFSKKI